jgi:DNA polymerase-3 subunit epsilon
MERRNLAAAYKFYCGRKMEEDFEAHRADQDAEATWRVLQAEIDYYSPERQPEAERQLKNDVDFLAEFSKPSTDNVDFAGRIVWMTVKDKDGNVELDEDGNPRRTEVFNFGKHKGESVAQVLRYDLGFYNWMMQADFPANTKQVLTRIKMKVAQGLR